MMLVPMTSATHGDAPPATFDELLARHRRALHVHCYRMLGSYTDADDLVQEVMIRAWTARETYDPATGAPGLRRWLHRIATNACLDYLKSAPRRVSAQATSFHEVAWLQPYPDRLLDEAAVAKETIALAYLALIQLLPAQQRAVFLCRDRIAEITTFEPRQVGAFGLPEVLP